MNLEKLHQFLSDAQVSTDAGELEEISRYTGFEKAFRPVLIVRPKTGEEIEKIVKWAAEGGVPLCPVSSSGARNKNAAVPSAEGVVAVDLRGMNKILSINRQQRTIVIEPGVTYTQLIPELLKNDLEMPMSLAPKAGKSVVADLLEIEPRLNSMRQWNYIDPLRCLEIIWGDGNRMFTGDAAGGPMNLEKQWEKQNWQTNGPGPMMVDYYRLLTGAQGTMGIAGWASVKCDVRAKAHFMSFVASDDIGKLIDFMYDVIHVRFSDELLLMNRICLKCVTGCTGDMPEWIVLVGVAGRDLCALEHAEGQRLDIGEMATKCGLELRTSLGSLDGETALKAISSPCEDGKYWKTAAKGCALDIVFETTLDKAPELIRQTLAGAENTGYETAGAAVYIQPRHQGASCACEIVAPYAPEEKTAAEKAYNAAVNAAHAAGAYFMRPYGELMSALQLGADSVVAETSLELKKIFDPKGIMNPGKLCNSGREAE